MGPSLMMRAIMHRALQRRRARAAEANGASEASAGQALAEAATAGTDAADPEELHHEAQAGIAGAGQKLPHFDRIQAAFGKHDIGGVHAHVGGAAREASESIGADAYATGHDVAFASTPDLHTAAHEAAHVVQQRGGVQLKGGVGQEGDAYERHADAVADLVVSGRSAEALLDEKAGGPSAAGRHVQRSLSRQTLSSWRENAAKKTAQPSRKKAFAEITQLIEEGLRSPNFNPQPLKEAVQRLMGDPEFAKYQPALKAVLDDIRDDEQLSLTEIIGFLRAHRDELLPPGAGDLSDGKLRELRERILRNYLSQRGLTRGEMNNLQRIKGIAARGIIEGQWVARGLCEEAINAYPGGGAKNINPRNNGSTIRWNHHVFVTGEAVCDPTWKQFFKLGDTAGKPPIFEGTADEFRALGLPEEDTRQYLRFLGVGARKQPRPEQQLGESGGQIREEVNHTDGVRESGNGERIREEVKNTDGVRESGEGSRAPKRDARTQIKLALKSLYESFHVRAQMDEGRGKGPQGILALIPGYKSDFDRAASLVEAVDPEAFRRFNTLRDSLVALLEFGGKQPMLELSEEEREAFETDGHYQSKTSDLGKEESRLEGRIDKNDLLKSFYTLKYKDLRKKLARNRIKAGRAKAKRLQLSISRNDNLDALVTGWAPYPAVVQAYQSLNDYTLNFDLVREGVIVPSVHQSVLGISHCLEREEDYYGFLGRHDKREQLIEQRKQNEE